MPERATFSSRFVAGIIDAAISLPGYFFWLLPGIALEVFKDHLTKRQSIGRKAMDIRLVSVKTGDQPSGQQKFARNLTAFLLVNVTLGAYLIADLITILAREDGRSVTDLIFGTWVIKVPQHSDVAPDLSKKAGGIPGTEPVDV